MCEFGVLDVFGYTPTEPHGLTSLLYRRQPPLGSLRSARYASPLSVTPGGLLQGHRAPPIYRNIFTLPQGLQIAKYKPQISLLKMR